MMTKIFKHSSQKLRWNSKESWATALVKISSCWKADGTWMIDMYFLPTRSLRKWRRTSMYFELEFVMGFCAICPPPSLSSRTSTHGMPTSGSIKRQTCLGKSTSFITSAIATYPASVVESVTIFSVLENQDTQAPPHITNPPETDLLSAALLA